MLTGQPYERNQSTDGIDILNYEISVNGQDVKQLRLKIYDFGGQEVFYPTHRFFLTADCTYLLLFKLIDVNNGRIRHWLKVLNSMGRNLPEEKRPQVLIVGTFKDQLRNDVEANEVLKKVKGMASKEGKFLRVHSEVFMVDARNAKIAPQIISTLQTMARQTQLLNKPLPTYFQVFDIAS